MTLWLECRAVHVVLFSTSSRLRRGKRDGGSSGGTVGAKSIAWYTYLLDHLFTATMALSDRNSIFSSVMRISRYISAHIYDQIRSDAGRQFTWSCCTAPR